VGPLWFEPSGPVLLRVRDRKVDSLFKETGSVYLDPATVGGGLARKRGLNLRCDVNCDCHLYSLSIYLGRSLYGHGPARKIAFSSLSSRHPGFSAISKSVPFQVSFAGSQSAGSVTRISLTVRLMIWTSLSSGRNLA
jgi:hypothetical protein